MTEITVEMHNAFRMGMKCGIIFGFVAGLLLPVALGALAAGW